ncbi:hypothetical protein CBR_g41805 [Chara braunii]|uniref:Probable Ufm1-specific protease n=1 Tax=Chara braunii TaxID=69332 RepID=A0A388LX02_CHABU|nr:hypothetical protein CBR_g41805 [Chara braunii]|eukprot:GBG86739.1 hypothetical protein CBR_g41805 [Chara braunii]
MATAMAGEFPSLWKREGLEESFRQLSGREVAGGGGPLPVGWLVGVAGEKEGRQYLTILSAIRCCHFVDNEDGGSYGARVDVAKEREELSILLPRGLSVIGAFFRSEADDGDRLAKDVAFLKRKVVEVRDGSAAAAAGAELDYIVIGHVIGVGDDVRYYYLRRHQPNNEVGIGGAEKVAAAAAALQESEVRMLPGGLAAAAEWLWKDWALVRCEMTMNFPVYFTVPVDLKEYRKNVSRAIDEMAAQVRTGARTVFTLESGSASGSAQSTVAGAGGDRQQGGGKAAQQRRQNVHNQKQQSAIAKKKKPMMMVIRPWVGAALEGRERGVGGGGGEDDLSKEKGNAKRKSSRSCPDGGNDVEEEEEEEAEDEEVVVDSQDFVPTVGGIRVPRPMTLKVWVDPNADDSAQSAPMMIEYLPAKGKVGVKRINLRVDVICCVPRGTKLVQSVVQSVVPALLDQFSNAERMAAVAAGSGSGSGLAEEEGEGGEKYYVVSKEEVKIAAFHFCPPGFPHPITVVYSLSRGEAEMSAVNVRKALHARLGLPIRPLLRVANALSFSPEVVVEIASSSSSAAASSCGRLRDVHVGLPPSGIPGGQSSIIDGSYEYYHYMQDRTDDKGWGCAYRSLQTIISWFRLQQYTSVPVPSHRKIQGTLVDIGDKEASFVGSTQWIGAIELSYVLDQLLGVTCKILTVSSGADMPTKGRELARHFQTQGTPVMIGGGVLAYTLLGVDYNETTGECAFLILDPHYTGAEDLKSIQKGKWCAWKKTTTETGGDFFVRSAFYNLLLPQRPVEV